MRTWPEISAWRKRKRVELIERRMSIPVVRRRELSAEIVTVIEQAFPLLRRMVIAFCWPYRGEVDVRRAIHAFRQRGATAALPVVVAKGTALQFRQWWPGVAMVPGALDIPAPQDSEVVIPDAAIVPLVGFDGQGFRLGYGGGYFDRTLAALERMPLAVGVGTEAGRLPTIHPQPHDIPMDFIVTEAGVHAVADGRLERLPIAAAATLAERLAVRRGLCRAR